MTPLRPDLVLRSESSKHVIVMGLSWEDCREEANERKKAEYLELTEECKSNRWAFQRVENIIDAAERASRLLWIKRGDSWCSALLGH